MYVRKKSSYDLYSWFPLCVCSLGTTIVSGPIGMSFRDATRVDCELSPGFSTFVGPKQGAFRMLLAAGKYTWRFHGADGPQQEDYDQLSWAELLPVCSWIAVDRKGDQPGWK